MAEKVSRFTFAAGEVSDTLKARQDLARWQTAVDVLENMVVLFEGGVTRRPGTRFVLELKNEAQKGRQIPFRFSGTDSYNLVFNGGKMRVLKNGGFLESSPGVPYELAVPFVEADLEDLRWTPSGNVIWITCPRLKPQVLTRLGHTNWTIADYAPTYPAVDTQNVDRALTIQASAQTGAVSLTGVGGTIFKPEHVGTVFRLDEGDLSAVPEWLSGETGIVGGSLRRYLGNVYSASGGNAGTNPPVHLGGVESAGQGLTNWGYEHSGYGFVLITAVTGPTTATGTVVPAGGTSVVWKLPNTVVLAPTYRWAAAAWSDAAGWPTLVRLHGDRLWFFRGNLFWATQIDAFDDFRITDDPNASGIAGRVTSPDGSYVNAEWALASGLLVLGARDAEFLIRGTATYEALTTLNTRAVPDSNEGSAPHVPALVDGGALFVGRSRTRLHYAPFDRLSERLDVDEVTKTARHILRGRANRVAFQKDPHRIAWISQENGKLAGLTFMPKEEVRGWHRHPTAAIVEDINTIPAGDESSAEVYFIMRRTINGSVRRYIEQLAPFFEPIDGDNPTADGAWFVECGLRYQGPAVTTIGGLTHLIGQTVAIHADGAGHPTKVVSNTGTITLDRASLDVIVGLPMSYRCRLLPFDVTQGRSSKGARKRANHVVVDMAESAGGTVSVNGRTPSQLMLTGGGMYGGPIGLVTGAQDITAEATLADECVVEIAGDDTMPFTLTGVTTDLDVVEGQ